MREPVWHSRQILPLGVTLDFLTDAPISEGIFEETNYLVQSVDPLILGIWYGSNQNLDTFRTGLGGVVTFGPEEEISICGLPARRLVATVEESSATGLVSEPGGELGHVYSVSPGVTHVAVAFRLRDHGVLIKWQVATDQRQAYYAAEQHFFGAITCTQ